MTAIRVTMPETVDTGGDPAEGRWSQPEMLLASVVDELRFLRWTYTTAHTDKKPPPAPDPIQRPGVRRKDKPKFTSRQTQILFNHINGLPQEPGVHLTVVDGGG